MTHLGRRLARLEAAGTTLEGPHRAVVIYDPAEGADATLRRLYGDAPPSVVLCLPDNGRDPNHRTRRPNFLEQETRVVTRDIRFRVALPLGMQ